MEQLVPGDIVRLSAGDMIPADLRLLSAKDLFINQSALTGEAMPVGEIRAGRERRRRRRDPFDLPNICFMGANVVSRLCHRRHPAHRRARPFSAQLAEQIAGRRIADRLRPRHQQIHLADGALHLVMAPAVFLINGLTKHDWLEALLFARRRRRRPDAGNAADDRDGQSRQGRDRDVAREGDRQAPARDPEFRRDGRLVHRQDRHPDPGPHHPEALVSTFAARIREKVLQYAYLNSHFQSGLAQPARHAVLDHVDLHKQLDVDGSYKQARRNPVRLLAAAPVGRRRAEGRQAHSDLQGRGGGDLRGLQPLRARRRNRPARREPSGDRANDRRRTLNADGFRVVAVAYKEMAPSKTTYSIADESDLTLLGYIAFLDPPKESARRGHRGAGRARRGGEDPHRRQRNRHAQDLPGGRPRSRRNPARRRDRQAERRGPRRGRRQGRACSSS